MAIHGRAFPSNLYYSKVRAPSPQLFITRVRTLFFNRKFIKTPKRFSYKLNFFTLSFAGTLTGTGSLTKLDRKLLD
jgi:hypothetical protein